MITPKNDAEQQRIAIGTLNHNLEVLANLDINDYLMVDRATDRIDVTRWWLRSSAFGDFVRAIDRTFHQTVEQEIGSKSLRQQYERAYDNLFKLMKSYETTEAVSFIKRIQSTYDRNGTIRDFKKKPTFVAQSMFCGQPKTEAETVRRELAKNRWHVGKLLDQARKQKDYPQTYVEICGKAHKVMNEEALPAPEELDRIVEEIKSYCPTEEELSLSKSRLNPTGHLDQLTMPKVPSTPTPPQPKKRDIGDELTSQKVHDHPLRTSPRESVYVPTLGELANARQSLNKTHRLEALIKNNDIRPHLMTLDEHRSQLIRILLAVREKVVNEGIEFSDDISSDSDSDEWKEPLQLPQEVIKTMEASSPYLKRKNSIDQATS